jgi:hypothetical protein
MLECLDLKISFKVSTLYLIPGSRVLLEKKLVIQLVKKCPAYYGIQRLITMFVRAHHMSY